MAVSPSVTREQGYVNPYADEQLRYTDWMMWDLLEEVPDLVYPLSLPVFAKMPKDDSRLWSLLAAIRLPILRNSYWIDPNGARDEVVAHLAADLGLPIKGDGGGDKKANTRGRRKGRFSWKAHVRSALTHLQYGHSVFEQVYDPARPDGKLHLHKLAPRPQSTISKWHVARDGGLIAIEQEPPRGAPVMANLAGVKLDVSRLVVYRNEPEDGIWIGQSLLRPAYKNWILKNELIRLEAVAVRRNGVGTPVVTAPPGIDAAMGSAGLKPYLDFAKGYRAGNTAGGALPNGATMQLLGVMGQRVDPRPAIEYHDRAIGLVALQHFLNLDGKGGSYALANVQEEPYTQAVQAVLDDMLDITNTHVVEDLVDLNYSIDENAPLIGAAEIASRQDATAAALNLLVSAGLIVPDARLRAFIRQNLGAPPEDPDTQDDTEDDEPDLQPPAATAPEPPKPSPKSSRRKGENGDPTLW
ncbi:Mu-like prophage protein gp29 [Mycobacteroides abscessus subsp. bolletii]|uniref:phage portal protein family protein n=1 Tax=Mycobacteroides abscessus TaxID=36809 RepID=UPI0009A8EB19|nr:hypothetical protein [Mycobacteroides abscessus]SLD51454.1 Mu-like prophage protein gp29 [Mycobacteroides abscessus subsp. bolletii]